MLTPISVNPNVPPLIDNNIDTATATVIATVPAIVTVTPLLAWSTNQRCILISSSNSSSRTRMNNHSIHNDEVSITSTSTANTLSRALRKRNQAISYKEIGGQISMSKAQRRQHWGNAGALSYLTSNAGANHGKKSKRSSKGSTDSVVLGKHNGNEDDEDDGTVNTMNTSVSSPRKRPMKEVIRPNHFLPDDDCSMITMESPPKKSKTMKESKKKKKTSSKSAAPNDVASLPSLSNNAHTFKQKHHRRRRRTIDDPTFRLKKYDNDYEESSNHEDEEFEQMLYDELQRAKATARRRRLKQAKDETYKPGMSSGSSSECEDEEDYEKLSTKKVQRRRMKDAKDEVYKPGMSSESEDDEEYLKFNPNRRHRRKSKIKKEAMKVEEIEYKVPASIVTTILEPKAETLKEISNPIEAVVEANSFGAQAVSSLNENNDSFLQNGGNVSDESEHENISTSVQFRYKYILCVVFVFFAISSIFIPKVFDSLKSNIIQNERSGNIWNNETEADVYTAETVPDFVDEEVLIVDNVDQGNKVEVMNGDVIENQAIEVDHDTYKNDNDDFLLDEIITNKEETPLNEEDDYELLNSRSDLSYSLSDIDGNIDEVIVNFQNEDENTDIPVVDLVSNKFNDATEEAPSQGETSSIKNDVMEDIDNVAATDDDMITNQSEDVDIAFNSGFVNDVAEVTDMKSLTYENLGTDYIAHTSGAKVIYLGNDLTQDNNGLSVYPTSSSLRDELPFVNRLLFQSNRKFYGYPPEAALNSYFFDEEGEVSEEPLKIGRCWAFAKSSKSPHDGGDNNTNNTDNRPGLIGNLSVDVSFSKLHHLTAIMIEHPLNKTTKPQSAIKEFRVLAYRSNGSPPLNLGSFTYEIDTGSPDRQIFPLNDQMDTHASINPITVKAVTVAIDSNWGHEYSCLYRVSLYGKAL